MTDRRAITLLLNSAQSAAQVRPLLPASALGTVYGTTVIYDRISQFEYHPRSEPLFAPQEPIRVFARASKLPRISSRTVLVADCGTDAIVRCLPAAEAALAGTPPAAMAVKYSLPGESRALATGRLPPRVSTSSQSVWLRS